MRKRGRVILHAYSFSISNVRFVVQKAGRQKVLEQKRKNVHAFVRGDFVMANSVSTPKRQVTYNPYKKAYFFDVDTKKRVDTANVAFFSGDGKVYYS
jgi:hypothetical protein